MKKIIDYFFCSGNVPTEEETEHAKKMGAILLNGLYGDSFNKPVGNAYGFGMVPKHLLKKVPEAWSKLEKTRDAKIKKLEAEQNKLSDESTETRPA